MQTIKTAVVVVMLLAVLYGAYVALNGTDTPLPPELQQLAEDFSTEPDVQIPTASTGLAEPSPLSPSIDGSKEAIASTGSGATPPSFEFPVSSQSTNSTSTAPFPSLDAAPKTPATLVASPKSASESGPSTASTAPLTTESSTPTFSSPFPAAPSLTSSTQADATKSDSPSSNDADPSFAAPPSFTGATKSDSDLASSQESELEPVTDSDLPNSTTSRSYENAKKLALEQIADGKLKEALATLSVFYSSPELTSQQNYELLDILDPLAGEVIYSRRHLLDIPHEVGPGETIETIAKQYEIQPELLSRVNALSEGKTPPVGTKLKIIPGPFRAEVDLKHGELTMFVGELYAGRFAVSIGQDPPPREGPYQVVGKQLNRNYYGAGGTQIAGNDPRNPYGGVWIDLGHNLCIHGSPAQAGPASANVTGEKLGCISLSPIDARDVFGMLGFDCKVQIKNGR